MNVRVIASADGGFEVVFCDAGGNKLWGVTGFGSDTAAQEFVRDFMVKMMVALRPMN